MASRGVSKQIKFPPMKIGVVVRTERDSSAEVDAQMHAALGAISDLFAGTGYGEDMFIFSSLTNPRPRLESAIRRRKLHAIVAASPRHFEPDEVARIELEALCRRSEVAILYICEVEQ